jgi:WD40 repeat protein/tetratricopeptide (TPR) repeat protein
MSVQAICPQGHVWDPAAADRCPVCGSTERSPAASVPGFTLVQRLGHDRLGTVYQARQVLHNRAVTLHLLRDDALPGPQALADFCTDARNAARVSHPNLISIVEEGDADGRPYLAAEFVPGVNLRERLDEAPFTAGEAARLTEALAGALAEAHRHNVIHGNIDPTSIRVTPDGTPRLGDLGLSVLFRGPAFAGDPAYAAPEQFAPNAVLTAAVDVYGLGALLYALLTSRPPFFGPTPEETRRLAATAEPVAPRLLRPDVPPDLEYVCLKCLSKRPSGRFPSAQALADALRSMREGKPLGGAAFRAVRWARRNAVAAAAGAAICVLAIAATVAVTMIQLRAASARREAEEAQRQARENEKKALGALREQEKAKGRIDAGAGEADARHRAALAQAQADARAAKADARSAVQARQEALRQRDEEIARRATADDRAGAAADSAKQAAASRTDAMRQLAAGHVAAGARALDAGDRVASLLSFAEALRLAHQEKLPEGPHRLRIAAVLAQCPRPSRLVLLPKNTTAVHLSREGGRALAVADDGTFSVWDLETRKRIGGVFRHDAAITHAALSPDGRRALSASATGAVRLWNVEEGKEVTEALQVDGPVQALAFSPDGRRFLAVSLQPAEPMTIPPAEVRVWKSADGEAVGEPLTNQIATRPASFSPDGSRVLTVCTDKAVRAWDPATGKQVGADLGHDAEVVHAEFGPDGRAVLTATADGSARVWNAVTGSAVTPVLKHGAAVERAAFSPSGRHVLTAGEDMAVRLWDAASGAAVGDPLRHGRPVVLAAFSADGRHIVSGTAGGTLRLWDVQRGEQAAALHHNGPVRSAAFAAGAGGLVTVDGRVLRRWDLTAGEPMAPAGYDDPDRYKAFSPDGRRAVEVSDTTAQVHDPATHKPVGKPLAHKQPVGAAVFSADGRRVLTITHPADPAGAGTPTWEVRAWDVETGKPQGEPCEHLREVTSAAFSPDGSRVLTLCKDKRARLWDPTTGKQTGKPMEHNEDLDKAVFAPGGAHVVTVCVDGTVRVWVTATGERVGKPMGHEKQVRHLAFSGDGKLLATACADGTARVWNTLSGEPETSPLPHDAEVSRTAFSPDARFLATAALDRTVRVWEVGSGKPVMAPLPHRDTVGVVAFSADGRLLVTAAGNTVRVWDAATGEPIGPPTKHAYTDRPVWYAALGKDGTLTTAAGPGTRWSRPLRADDRPADDLVMLAQVLLGRKAKGVAGTVALEPVELEEAWRTLAGKYGDEVEVPPARQLAWARRGAAECERRGLWAGAELHLGGLMAEAPKDGELAARRAQARVALGRWDGALADYTKAIDLGLKRWDVWAGRAEAAAGLRRWEQAAGDYGKAIELEGRRGGLWLGRGRAEAERGRWTQAADDLGKAIRFGRGEPEVWHEYAVALLSAGDADNYRRACARLLKRHGNSEDAPTARTVARACTLAPGAVTDFEALRRQAGQAVKANPESAEDVRILGWLLYRAGQHESAVTRFKEALKLQGGDGDVRDWLGLAMASQRLGRAEEAKDWLAKATARLDDPKAKDGGVSWTRRQERQLLRREAEALVKAKP